MVLNYLSSELLLHYISINYEIVTISVIKETVPQAIIHGCYYHLTKQFRGKMGYSEVLSSYSLNASHSIIVMATVLELVPIRDLDPTIHLFANEFPYKFIPLLEWFNEYYIGKKN